MRILLLAPHPFFQARGSPLAVKTLLEFLSFTAAAMQSLTGVPMMETKATGTRA